MSIAHERLILALDYPDAQAALKLVDELGDEIQFYKVGLQLFIAAAHEVVTALKQRGKRVFLDLKFHDIPHTVAGAVRSAGALGVDMLTVHASGGKDMLQVAARTAHECSPAPMVLGVTVLTSMDAPTLLATGIIDPAEDQVVRLASLARAAGCGGIVCSPEEIDAVRSVAGPETRIVVPGIRPQGAASADQARFATPSAAIHSGADYLVIGRPITGAANPRTAARNILSEMEQALAAHLEHPAVLE